MPWNSLENMKLQYEVNLTKTTLLFCQGGQLAAVSLESRVALLAAKKVTISRSCNSTFWFCRTVSHTLDRQVTACISTHTCMCVRIWHFSTAGVTSAELGAVSHTQGQICPDFIFLFFIFFYFFSFRSFLWGFLKYPIPQVESWKSTLHFALMSLSYRGGHLFFLSPMCESYALW